VPPSFTIVTNLQGFPVKHNTGFPYSSTDITDSLARLALWCKSCHRHATSSAAYQNKSINDPGVTMTDFYNLVPSAPASASPASNGHIRRTT
jgi:hypothetical protein